ncbi:MAG: class I SAM-dependent methyltransferase [Clostridiales bacterium]|nr:class I SAM-dependent methyltransferase [Clostridiales bacterium]
MNTNKLIKMLKKPEIYMNGTDSIWTNPYTAKNMLEAHLDDSHDGASYRIEKRDKIINYIMTKSNLCNNDSLVDFGCGAGLYVNKFANLGIMSTGIDFSENSIKYARNVSKDNIDSNFIHSDYTKHIDFEREHDIALIISKDYGVLPENNRKNLLSNINNSLVCDGYFFFDVPSYTAYEKAKTQKRSTWSISQKSFYRPHEHLKIEADYFYDKEKVSCKSVLIVDDKIQIYRMYQTYFSIEKITKELKDCGFTVQEVLSNLEGEAYNESSHTIGLVSRKK